MKRMKKYWILLVLLSTRSHSATLFGRPFCRVGEIVECESLFTKHLQVFLRLLLDTFLVFFLIIAHDRSLFTFDSYIFVFSVDDIRINSIDRIIGYPVLKRI